MFDHFAPPPAQPHQPLARLLDVTLRDGGFEVDFRWPTTTPARVTTALEPCGIDIVELGYLGGLPKEHGMNEPGIGAHISPDLIATARRPGLTLAAMVHPSALRADLDLRAYERAGLGMVRFVYHPDWAEAIAAVALRAAGNGLAVTVNIALASRYGVEELLERARRICDEVEPDVLYIADTCGALLPDQVAELVGRLRRAAPPTTQIGFHAHDFLTLAYANSLTAVHAGATYLDCSLLGLGRGSGNLGTELMLLRHHLRDTEVSLLDLRELLDCREHIRQLAGRESASLVSMTCAALNLTPVEEGSLRAFANDERLDVELVALWAAGAMDGIDSLRPEGLRAAWTKLGAMR